MPGVAVAGVVVKEVDLEFGCAGDQVLRIRTAKRLDDQTLAVEAPDHVDQADRIRSARPSRHMWRLERDRSLAKKDLDPLEAAGDADQARTDDPLLPFAFLPKVLALGFQGLFHVDLGQAFDHAVL